MRDAIDSRHTTYPLHCVHTAPVSQVMQNPITQTPTQQQTYPPTQTRTDRLYPILCGNVTRELLCFSSQKMLNTLPPCLPGRSLTEYCTQNWLLKPCARKKTRALPPSNKAPPGPCYKIIVFSWLSKVDVDPNVNNTIAYMPLFTD